MQVGFRPGRTTFAKIWSLAQIIDDAKAGGYELHVSYIDLKKAYDSVEHWGVEQVLTQYGFNTTFVTAIKAICTQSRTSIITPHGLTSPINITRGPSRMSFVAYYISLVFRTSIYLA